MILFLRIIPFVSSLLLLIAFEIPIFSPGLFWAIIPIIAVLALVPTAQLMKWKTESREFWHFLVTPFLLLVSTVMLLVFVSDTTIAHIIAAVTTILYGWYLENLFLFYHQTFRYQAYALENTTRYSNLLTVFFLMSALFAARLFLSLNAGVVLGIGVIATLVLTLQMLWSGKIIWTRGMFVLFTVTLIMAEFTGAVLVLPTSYFVAGLLLTIPYYLMMNLIRHAIEGNLDSRVLKRYAVIGIGSFLVTFFSAPWK